MTAGKGEKKPFFFKGMASSRLTRSSGWPHTRSMWATEIGLDGLYLERNKKELKGVGV